MYEINTIIKLINKKYFLNEFLYIQKDSKENFEVLVVDSLNKRVYMEETYPKSLIEESKIKEYTKKEFLDELNEDTKKLLIEKFPLIYDALFHYDEQKSLF